MQELQAIGSILNYPHLLNIVYEDAKLEFESIPDVPLEQGELLRWVGEREAKYGLPGIVWDEGPSKNELAKLADDKLFCWDTILLYSDYPWVWGLYHDWPKEWLEDKEIPTWLQGAQSLFPPSLKGRPKSAVKANRNRPIDHCAGALVNVFDLPLNMFQAIRTYIARGDEKILERPQKLTISIDRVKDGDRRELRATVYGIDEFSTADEWRRLWSQVQLYKAPYLMPERFQRLRRHFGLLQGPDDPKANELAKRTLLIRRAGKNLKRDMQWYRWAKEGLKRKEIIDRWNDQCEGNEKFCVDEETVVIKALHRLEQRMRPNC